MTSGPWIAVIGATVLLQMFGTFLLRVPPTIAPMLMANAGLSEAAIGHFSALNTLASIMFLLIGAPLVRRFGSVRSLQLGAAVSAFGTLLFLAPNPVAIGAAMFLIGFGYGPAPSAGSDILQRYAPINHRSLVFSIKQAGAPLGGVLAGLVMPVAASTFGIWGAVAACLVIGVLVIGAVEPLRAEVDADRKSATAIGPGALFARHNIAEPFLAVTRTPALIRLALAGMCFSVCQGVWFAFLVTFLVVRLGYSLELAGIIFAITQVTGVFGRVVLGWASDRLGSGQPVQCAAGIASCACSLVLAFATASWPVWSLCLLAAFAGVAVSSWNGVQMAEMVRIAPGEIHTTVAGGTAVVFLGYMFGPPLFALLLDATGRYDVGFICVAAIGVAGAALSTGRR